MKSGQLNPTLSVEAYFSVVVDGDNRRTKFDLHAYRDVAAWLLTLLDYVLYRQGKVTEEKRIAEPPGGATRQLLVDGRIIRVAQRPDGGLMLSLSPEIDVRLMLYARRRGACAASALLALTDDPDLTRWVLTHCVQGPSPSEMPTLSATLTDSLRRHAVLVDEPPPPEAYYPDPAQPADIAAELAPASRIFRQPAGSGIPAEVRQALGRHTPALPPGCALLWGQDAGTGMMYPGLWSETTAGPDPQSMAGGAAATARRALWDTQQQAARDSLRTRRYAALREIVPAAQQDKLRHYLRQLVERGYFPALGDGQVKLRSALHNQPTIASLHNGLAGIVSRVCGEPVIASYCYLSCYEEGAVLERHKDRPQCAYNLSLVLDMQCAHGEPEPWPIYLELDDKPEAVLLQVGDGLVYSGTEIWHWREALPAGYRAIVCFFHFVPQGFTGSLD